MKSHLFAWLFVSILGTIMFAIGALAVVLHNEPYPYRLLTDIDPPGYFEIEIADTPVDQAPKVAVRLYRRERCGYFIEYRVWDSKRTKLAEFGRYFSEPRVSGEDQFNAQRTLDQLAPGERPALGRAFDEFRIGAACNPWQRYIKPNWGPGWVRTQFNFIEPGLK